MRTQAVVISLLVAACVDTPNYYYAPEQAAVVRAGMPTRIENIPQEAPQGTVEISTMGITKGKRGEPALHVRMTLNNEGDDVPWTVDIREQLVEIPGVGRSQPQAANAGYETLPTVTVPRRDRRIVDLYYPVPPRVKDADNLIGFEFLWHVNTARRPISGRTVIDRREVIEPSVGYGYVAGWEPYWWHDPWYPRVGYSHIVVRPHVHVHRHQRAHRSHRSRR